MSIAVGILVHNLYRYERLDLFRATLASLAAQDPDQFYLVSNGSDDGTEDYIAGLGGTVVNDPITTCGHGMNVTLGILAKSGCEFGVFSNDDIVWKPGALLAVSEFLREAPDDIVIASGLLEDDFPWNTVRDRVEYGGHPALVRATAPGGSWAIRTRDWPRIGPVPEAAGWDDVPTCNRLTAKGYRVCQLDLCKHIGEQHSTWGNDSARHGKPLDRRKWRI